MEAQCVVDLQHQMGRDSADHRTNSLQRDRPDLFGLGLGVLVDARLIGGEEHLKGEDPRDVAGDGYHRDDSLTQTGCRRVGAVIAHEDRWPTFVGLTCECWVKVGQPDLTAQHQ